MSRMLWTWSRTAACAATQASPSTGSAAPRLPLLPSRRIDFPHLPLRWLQHDDDTLRHAPTCGATPA
jgi:hypothetical protein